MSKKYMPLIMMLVAGAVTSIITFILDYTIPKKLLSLVIVLMVFYIFGSVLKSVITKFEEQNAKAALDEGEVVEKEQTEDSANE